MNRVAIGWVAGFIVLALWVGLAVGQQTRPSAGSTGEITALIKQLDSEAWAEREAAEAQLIQLGSEASAPLKAAVKAGTMDLEGKSRAERILSLVGVPDFGAVWRQLRGADAAEHLEDGDVVVTCNGQPVASVSDLQKALADENTLECWHQGKGKFTVELKSRPSGFMEWPDRLGIYEQVGERGPWYDGVCQAIRYHYDGSPRAAAAFAKAWKDGCRDSILVATWLEELLQQGALKQLDRLWDEELSRAKLRFPPGDNITYGAIPYCRAHAKLAQGQREQAAEVLRAALDAASKAQAPKAVAALHLAQLEMQLTFDSSAAALKAFQEQQDTLYRDNQRGALYFLCLLAMKRQAEAGPDKVLELLKTQPETPTRTMLTDYYEAQVPLAAAAAPAAPHHWVLVKAENEGTFLRAAVSYFGERVLAEGAAPLRVECQARVISFPLERSRWQRMASVHLNGEGGVILRLNWNGSLKADWGGGNGLEDPAVRDPLAWMTCALEVQRGVTRISVNGQPQWAQYHEPTDEGFKALLSASGVAAEFRNLRIYVGTDAAVDTTAIEEQFKKLDEARSAGNPAAGIAPIKKLAELLGPVPEAQAQVPPLAFEQWVLEGLAAQAGWNLTSDQGALVGKKYGDDNIFDPTGTVFLPLGDFELRGVADLTKAGSDPEVVLQWSSRDSAQVQRVSITRTQIAAGNARHWDAEARHPDSGVVPFCIRIRGQEGVIFSGAGKAPAGRFPARDIRPLILELATRNLTTDGEVRLQDLTIRALSKDEKLDAPVELPKP